MKVNYLIIRDSKGRIAKGSIPLYKNNPIPNDVRKKMSDKAKERIGELAPRWNGGKLEFECNYCKQTFLSYKSHTPKYCSKKCFNDYQKQFPLSGELSKRWKGGYQNKLWHNNQRRIIKLGNGGSHTVEEWEQLKQDWDNLCLCCLKQEPAITLSIDHIIPLSKNGTDDIENIQPLCRSCNSRKYNKVVRYA